MPDCVVARCLGFLSLLLIAETGCQSLQGYRPVQVLVRDAETKKPIPGAEVLICYPLARPSSAPRESRATTAQDGIARLQAAPRSDAAMSVEGSAAGYMPEAQTIPFEAVPPMHLMDWFMAGKRDHASIVLEMFAEPRFWVELVLPNAYRGLVKVDVQIHDDAHLTPGQRCFRAVVPSLGDAVVSGPDELRRVFPTDYRALFADGTRLPALPGPSEVALRPLKREGSVEYFVVGTQADFEAMSPAPQSTSAESHSPAGKKGGGGRGGRGRRGNQTPSAEDNSGG
jgi:hypothetical protein